MTVPIYPTQALDQVGDILRGSGAKLLFLDRPATRKRMLDAGIDLPTTICFDGSDGGNLAALEGEAGEPVTHNAQPDDLAVLVYTSGTTGAPKGVMLSQHNIASNARSSPGLIADVLPGGDDVLSSAAARAHLRAHDLLWLLFWRHSVIHFSAGPQALLADLRTVRPRLFLAVPRIFERLLASIVGKARSGSRVQARLVPWALRAGCTAMRYRMRGQFIPPHHYVAFLVARALVLRRFRPLLGLDRLEFSVSGSASLHTDVIATLLAAGIPVMEGYGLSECSPIVTCNIPSRHRYGTVGSTIPDVDVRLADDGELFVRGPNVMQGYYNDPEATAAVMHDGWFATGDVGTLDKDGFLRIADRKKELFKTSGGKYVAPARVEAAIMRSPYVNQVVVFGNGRSHPGALVSPNWPLVRPLLEIPDDVATEKAAELDSVRTLLTRGSPANCGSRGLRANPLRRRPTARTHNRQRRAVANAQSKTAHRRNTLCEHDRRTLHPTDCECRPWVAARSTKALAI